MSTDSYWREGNFLPPLEVFQGDPRDPFLDYSTCYSHDFTHPRFHALSSLLGWQPAYRRKLWEWVAILHAARESFMAGYGKRALGFGVGAEPLPAALAAMGFSVVATDAPADVAKAWVGGEQYAGGLESVPRGQMTEEDFCRKVSFRQCDMTAIDADLTGFDFCWSSCALEHLGSLEAGVEFVINSVEGVLAPGGIACHTTEFNCSSNDSTVSTGPSVIYRRRDIEALIRRLRRRGHDVADLRIAPVNQWQDGHVDVPPFGQENLPHLKLELEGFVSTSLVLVIRRGSE